MAKRLAAMCLIIAMAFSLCSCKKEDKYTDGVVVGGTLSGEGGARLFSPELIPLPEGMIASNAVLVGNYIVLCAMQDGQYDQYKVFKVSLDDMTAEEVSGLTLYNVVSMFCNNGSVAIITSRTADGAYMQYFIYPDHAAGSDYACKEWEIPSALEGETLYSIQDVFTPGPLICETVDNVYACSPLGALTAFGPYSGGKQILPCGDDICIVSYNGETTKVQIVGRIQPAANAAVVEKESYTLDGQYTLYFGSGNLDEIYGWSNSDPNILYNINYRNGNKNAYANVFSSGCNPSCFIELGESKFFALTTEGQPAIWTVGKSDELKVITLATCSGDDMIVDRQLWKAVTSFNNASSEYRIDIIDYAAYNNGADPYGGYNKLNAEISAGNAPDIYDLWSLSTVNYAAKGLVEDLKPWFDADPDISYSDLIPSVVATLEKNSSLYDLVPSFSVATVFTTAERFGEAKHMTVSEFLDAADRLGAVKMFGSDMTRDKFLMHVLTYSGKEYFDLDSASCNFNTPEFARLLSFMAQLPEEEDPTTGDMENVYFGEQYLLYMGMDNMLNWITMSDAVFQGEVVSVGFPSSGDHGVSASVEMRLAMSASSELKEGVWQFFKYLLSDSYQTGVSSVPIKQSALDRVMEEWCEPLKGSFKVGLLQYVDGQIIQSSADIRQPDSSTFARAREIIDSVDCMGEYNAALYTIVSQELKTLAAGDCTAEQAAANIQSRASIYLSEQYG